jgi:hypothetical protein
MFFSPSFLFLPARGKINAEGEVQMSSTGQEAMDFRDSSCFLSRQVDIMNKETCFLPDSEDGDLERMLK